MDDFLENVVRILAEVKTTYVVMTEKQAEFYASLFVDDDDDLRPTPPESDRHVQ
jgi:hypothetical protein